MQTKLKVNQEGPVRDQRPSRSASAQGMVFSALLGLALGVLAKVADQSPVPGLGDVGTYLGAWVVVVTMIAVRAPSRVMAAMRAALALIGMVVAYYVTAYLYFRVIPLLDIAVWSIAALTAVPALAAFMWPARATGWPAAVGVALPVGLLVAEAWSLRHYVGMGLHIAPFVFDVLAALLLLVLLPSSQAQRLRSGALAVPVALVGVWLLTVAFGYAAGVLLRGIA